MSTAYQPSTFYVLPNNFLTVLFKGRCRRGGVTLRFFNTMDSIIINLTYTQAPHSPLFPNPNCSKRNNETMNECMLLKSKTKININTHSNVPPYRNRCNVLAQTHSTSTNVEH